MDTSSRAGSVPRSLAELARTIVSDASSASLVMVGMAAAPLGPDVIDLVEHAGTPAFAHRLDPRLAGALGATARLTVEDTRAHPATVSVVLTGRLMLGTQWCAHLDSQLVVALAVSKVVLRYDDPLSPAVVQRELPVDAYLDFRPDPWSPAR